MISAEANTSAKHNQHTPDSRVALEIAGLLFASTVINVFCSGRGNQPIGPLPPKRFGVVSKPRAGLGNGRI